MKRGRKEEEERGRVRKKSGTKGGEERKLLISKVRTED